MTDRRRLLLFDLGGVLVEYIGLEEVRRLYLGDLDEDAVQARFAGTLSLFAEFENGRMTSQEFGRAFVAAWSLDVAVDDFLVRFESWSNRLYPGAAELLAALRPRHRLAALSNSNVLHWRRNTDVLGVDDLFERAFSSHQIGFRKPDVRAYRFALDALGVQPDEVMFFDDVEDNVAAARKLGITAHQVVGVEGLRSRLQELGLV